MLVINGIVKQVKEITSAEKKDMLNLLQTYFDGIEVVHFEKDLQEKDYVILLKHEEKQIIGFSTLRIIDFPYQTELLKIVFSGDTIIDKSYWGSLELPKVWGKMVFALQKKEPTKRWFWFLISSGYKTYRFLPVFFKEFYPVYDKETPKSYQQLMDIVASYKFGNDYQKSRGIVSFSHSTERLKSGIAEVQKERLKDPHIAFFIEKNKRHQEGEELVCLCEITESNLTKAGKRVTSR